MDTFVRSGVFRTRCPSPRDQPRPGRHRGRGRPGAAGFRPGSGCGATASATAAVRARRRVRRGPRRPAVPPARRRGPRAGRRRRAPGRHRVPGAVHPRPGAAGETVYVAGAAGNVGAALVTMATDAGARVVATASARDAEYVRSLGAAEVLDYRDPELTERLRAACPHGVDVHIDTFGTNDLTAAVDLIAPRARIVLLAGVAARPRLPVGPST
ncbi:zinc-binding dehydrogenase [Streptomyces sp. M19]